MLYLNTAIKIRRLLRTQFGIRRLELQFLAFIAGIASLILAILNGLGNYFHLRLLNRSSILLVVAGYSIMAWALANHRIFNARHVLNASIHRVAVVGLLAVASWGGALGLSKLTSDSLAWFTSVAFCGLMVFWLDQKTRFWIGLDDEFLLSAFRSEVIHVSKIEPSAPRIIVEFERLLASYHGSRFAILLEPHGNKYVGGDIELPKSRAAFGALCQSVWTTPESLERRRGTPELDDLAAFLRTHSLSVMVTVPRGNPNPSLLVAVGIKNNEWPFTFPEVRRLQNVAELMDNSLARSRLNDLASIRARMEYLALLSRGLAHDLKNLITPVSSFLVYTQDRISKHGMEAEVHASALRSVRLMADYLSETMFFSQNLEPELKSVDVAKVLQEVKDVTSLRAKTRKVDVEVCSDFSESLTADGVLLQRLLANLVSNSIDASSPHRKVVAKAYAGRPGWLEFQVKDEGCGIPKDALDRVFDPYFTTKEFGENDRGFGLGLTICQKIVELHRGTIAVVSEVGRGTVVTVEIPTSPTKPTVAPSLGRARVGPSDEV